MVIKHCAQLGSDEQESIPQSLTADKIDILVVVCRFCFYVACYWKFGRIAIWNIAFCHSAEYPRSVFGQFNYGGASQPDIREETFKLLEKMNF